MGTYSNVCSGGDVREVFERLARGIDSVQETIQVEYNKNFAKTKKLGYLHSCPTNLGTGMRASVHIGESYKSFDRKRALVKYQSQSKVI